MQFFDALEVISDDGTGLPVSYTNTGIGLASDGHFYLITGRPGLDGSKTIAGDTARTVWYQGILAHDTQAFLPEWSCDFVEMGNVEDVSGMEFSILNHAQFWNTLQAHGVYLGRRKVKYYRVTSSDGVTFNFRLRWSGVIDDQPFSETTYRVQCVGAQKDFFGSAPPVPVNPTTFKNAPADGSNKVIPIALGRVARAPLVNVSGSGTKTTLAMLDASAWSYNGLTPVGNTPFSVAACLQYTPTQATPPADSISQRAVLRINTPGVKFTDTDARLVGRYAVVVAGGVQQAVRILDNVATYVSNSTDLILAENLDLSTPFKEWVKIDQTDKDVWYVEVVDYAATLLPSTKFIYSLRSNQYGQPKLATYDSSLKTYQDISGIVSLSSLTNINSTKYPGFLVASKSGDGQGGLTFYLPIVPTKVIVASMQGGWSSPDLPAIGSAAPLLNNLNANDFYTLNLAPASFQKFEIDLFLPSDAILNTLDALYSLFDLSHKISVGTNPIRIDIYVSARDMLGRNTGTIISAPYYTFKNSNLGSSYVDENRLPGLYYSISRSDVAFGIDKANFDIKSLYADTKKLMAYNGVRIGFNVSNVGSDVYTMQLREVGLVGKRTLSFSSETAYATLFGETFGTTWNGRRTAGNPILTLPDALEHLVRNYDIRAAAWQAGYAYAVGDQVRSTTDNGHIYVCSVAGTSGGSEPAFPTTSGATVTDGAVTWKELQTIPVDLPTFDTVATQLSGYFIGRSLTEKKTTLEYYKELCAQGFLIMLIDASGKVKLKAWRNNTTPLATFNANNIIEDSVGEMAWTPVRRASNDLLIQYDENPGAGAFNRQIAVTNVDKPAFPAITDTVEPGTDLGAFTATYSYVYPASWLGIHTTNPHGLTASSIVSLVGNADGLSFYLKPILAITGPNDFIVDMVDFLFATSPSTSGSLRSFTSYTLKWQKYVAGIQNYQVAKHLWMQCRSSYVITKAIQKLPEESGKCRWFLDPVAKDAAGNSLWADTVNPANDLTNVADAHPAVFFAQNVAEWTTWQKKMPTFEIEEAQALVTVPTEGGITREIEIGDPLYFNDAKITNGANLLGWVAKKQQLARTDKAPERFRLTLLLNPEQLVTCNRIIDTPGAANRILDTVGAANRILDVPC